MDLLDNARIKQLLEQAESAVRMLGQVDSHGKRQVKHALAGIYEDLGRHLHGLSRQLEARSTRTASHGEAVISIDELDDLTNEIENTDEVAMTNQQTAGLGVGSADWFKQQVDNTPVSVEQIEQTVRQSRGDIRQRLQTNEEDVNWLFDLENLLDMLDMSEQDQEPNELAVEAVKLQWATSTMTQSWLGYPRPIQMSLVGLLACRARALAERVPASLAPSIVLTRLKTHQRRAHIPPVVALNDTSSPEEETWTNDSTLWWNILASCVSE